MVPVVVVNGLLLSLVLGHVAVNTKMRERLVAVRQQCFGKVHYTSPASGSNTKVSCRQSVVSERK